MEYYFSHKNLERDSFMRDQIAANADGYVPLSLIMTFNRMQRMKLSVDEVTEILATKSTALELDTSGRRIRRRESVASSVAGATTLAHGSRGACEGDTVHHSDCGSITANNLLSRRKSELLQLASEVSLTTSTNAL